MKKNDKIWWFGIFLMVTSVVFGFINIIIPELTHFEGYVILWFSLWAPGCFLSNILYLKLEKKSDLGE